MDAETVTAVIIADAMKKAVRIINRRAVNENWPHEVVNRRGDRRFYLDRLPVDVRMAVAMWRVSQRGQMSEVGGQAGKGTDGHGPAFATASTFTKVAADRSAGRQTQGAMTYLPAPVARENRQPAPLMPLELRDWQLTKAKARADLMYLYNEYIKKHGFKKPMVQVKRDFTSIYNAGAYPVLFGILGATSYKTLERLRLKVIRHVDPLMALAPQHGKSKGKRSLGSEQITVLLSIVRSPYQPKKKAEIIRIARAVMAQKGIKDGLSDDTYRRFLDEWISTHYDQWVFWREGEKGLEDKCLFWIKRDYNKIDVGDVLVADGHTLNFETLNPWTGKPKRMTLLLWYDMKSSFPCGWEIMPTENAQAINAALRRAIIMLGKRPKIAYLDNGKAFASKFFNNVNLEESGVTGVYDRLGIKPVFAWPYHAQSKTVERFFESFAELERIAPSYVGTSIDEKPPRLHMGEKFHRKIHEKITGGRVPTLEETHRAVAAWFDEYARRPQQDGHLKGIRPIDVFLPGRGPGVDSSELRELMMSMEIRRVRRRGIKLPSGWYYSPALYGRTHSVIVKYDSQDLQSILVYDGREFLCEARLINDVHPMATHLGEDADRQELKDQIEIKKGEKKHTLSLAREILNTVVIPETTRQIASAGFSLEGPKIEDSAKKAEVVQLTDEDRASMQAEFDAREKEHQAMWTGRIKWDEMSRLTDMERYEKDLEYEAQRVLIPKDEQAFMRYFEQTAAFNKYADYFDEHRAKLTMMYQTN